MGYNAAKIKNEKFNNINGVYIISNELICSTAKTCYLLEMQWLWKNNLPKLGELFKL